MSYKCIYCKEQKSHTEFNSEHVVPKAFGLYEAETLTLVNKVCTVCNSRFGQTIDLELARKTKEGLYRFICGVRNTKDFDAKKHGKNQKRVAKTGLLAGQELELTVNPSGIGFIYKTKNKSDIALKRKKDGKYDYFLSDDMPDDLNEEGIILSEYKYDMNVISRGIAKIGFNYFAHHNDTDVLLQPCFDPIRDFIATGTGQWSDFLSIEKEPIVPDQNGRAADVHLITIFKAWDEIHASVSLHNQIHYKIFLTHRYEGGPIKTEYVNWFDPHAKKTGVLEKSSLVKKSVSLIVPVKSILYSDFIHTRG